MEIQEVREVMVLIPDGFARLLLGFLESFGCG
jgi:hypothetical protein